MMAQKRAFQEDDSNVKTSEEKKQRTNLTSVVMEAMRVNSIQKFWQALEPLLRRVVNEEVERALAKYVPPKIGLRPPPRQLQGTGLRKLRLQFQNRLSLPLFTGSKVEGELGHAIYVVLQDANTGQTVISGEEASAKLEIVVLEGDFFTDDNEDWSQEEFENHEVREREGKRPLLTGELALNLKEGVGTVGELIFTDNSSWIRSRKFRLGVKMSSGCCDGLRVREAKTEAFSVKDHRGELYKKHYPPTLSDEVWRLEKIGKDGAYHKRLNKENIFTVEDFLTAHCIEPQKLRDIFGTNMSNKTWDAILDHAKTCILSEKLRVYFPQDSRKVGVIFNAIYQPVGVITNGQYVPSDSLSETEKVHMDRLVQVAYKHLDSIVDYGDEVPGNQNLRGTNSYKDSSGREGFQGVGPQTGPVQRTAATPPHPLHMQSHPLHFFAGGSIRADELRSQVTVRYMGPTHQSPDQRDVEPMTNVYTNAGPSTSELSSSSYTHNSMQANALSSALALGPSLSSLSSFSYPYSSESLEKAIIGNGYYRKDLIASGQDSLQRNQFTEFSSDDGSPRRELGGVLESDDMQLQVQQLLRVFNAGTDQSLGLFSNSTLHGDEAFPFATLQTPPDLGRTRVRVPSRAYRGWIKLKAALKWGIVYKQTTAARRRAQIEELDD